jgi:hypothetical protein
MMAGAAIIHHLPAELADGCFFVSEIGLGCRLVEAYPQVEKKS